jgi:hypothetical protein
MPKRHRISLPARLRLLLALVTVNRRMESALPSAPTPCVL